jgi:hypothetical protein
MVPSPCLNGPSGVPRPDGTAEPSHFYICCSLLFPLHSLMYNVILSACRATMRRRARAIGAGELLPGGRKRRRSHDARMLSARRRPPQQTRRSCPDAPAGPRRRGGTVCLARVVQCFLTLCFVALFNDAHPPRRWWASFFVTEVFWLLQRSWKRRPGRHHPTLKSEPLLQPRHNLAASSARAHLHMVRTLRARLHSKGRESGRATKS